MRYYAIENYDILIADNEYALSRFYKDVYELPEDYVIGKYIVADVEEEVEVIDYDEEGNPIGTHTEIVTVQRLILNPNWDEEQAEKERIRIANLHMTRGDVFRGLLLAKGVTRADMRGLIEAMPETTPEQKIAKEYALIDFDEALEFYRGVSLIDTVGEQLGIMPHQMDRFFDTKDWHELINEE